MSLIQEIPDLQEHVKRNSDYLKFNKDLFNIYEGELLEYVIKAMNEQVSKKYLKHIVGRVAPINILKRVVDKLSKIYQQNPVRTAEDGTDKDDQLLTWYEENFMINHKMNLSDEFFNLFSASLIQPYVHQNKPRLRAIPNDRFLVYSNDEIDPLYPTHVIIIQKDDNDLYNEKATYHVYTDEEYMIFDAKWQVDKQKMAALENEEGINPYGKIPFVYVNRSGNLLIPKASEDNLQMTKLFPILLTDLNGATMFLSHSIIYGIDIDDENVQMSPNAFWRLKSDPTTETKPELGVITPQVKIKETIELIESQLSAWLETKGIRISSISNSGSGDAISGISKIIDEMDTAEDRKIQVVHYTKAEHELWDLVTNHLHPDWVKRKLIETNQLWTPGVKIQTSFHDQIPVFRRIDAIKEVLDELGAGLMSTRMAIKRLNPQFSEDQIDEVLQEIKEEGQFKIDIQESDNEPIENQEANEQPEQEENEEA